MSNQQEVNRAVNVMDRVLTNNDSEKQSLLALIFRGIWKLPHINQSGVETRFVKTNRGSVRAVSRELSTGEISSSEH